MHENINSKESMNEKRRAFLKGAVLVAGGAAIGLIGTPAVKDILSKSKGQNALEQPNVPHRIPSRFDLIKVPDSPTWISKEAREFLDNNEKITFDEKTGAVTVEDVRGLVFSKGPVKPENVKEILVDMSKDGSTIYFHYLARVDGGGQVVIVKRREDGGLEYDNAELP